MSCAVAFRGVSADGLPAGGLSAAKGDGGVPFVADTIDSTVFAALVSRDGG